MFHEQRWRLLPRGQPKSWGAWETLACAVEGLAVVGARDEAAELYPLILEALEEGLVLGAFHIRLIEKIAGVAAAAGRRWDEAEEHYRTAMRQAQELPHLIERAEVGRFWAQMLIERDRPGDRERARGLLEEAIRGYRQIGMPRHEEMAQILLDRLTARLPTQARDRVEVFRREGDYWTIVHEGQLFHLRDTKGLRYLAILLGNPGREIQATELAAGVEGAVLSKGLARGRLRRQASPFLASVMPAR
jgi:tetratricopeptide (TPR) repeat protein